MSKSIASQHVLKSITSVTMFHDIDREALVGKVFMTYFQFLQGRYLQGRYTEWSLAAHRCTLQGFSKVYRMVCDSDWRTWLAANFTLVNFRELLQRVQDHLVRMVYASGVLLYGSLQHIGVLFRVFALQVYRMVQDSAYVLYRNLQVIHILELYFIRACSTKLYSRTHVCLSIDSHH